MDAWKLLNESHGSATRETSNRVVQLPDNPPSFCSERDARTRLLPDDA